MNIDLKNFIDQARAAGKSDEVIKQELSKAGWQAGDISEALSTAPTASSLGVASVGASLISGKIIAAVVAVLLILGAGGYFMFFNKGSQVVQDNQSPVNNEQNTVDQEPSVITTPFKCLDLLNENDIQVYTKDKKPVIVKDTASSLSQGAYHLSCNFEQGSLAESMKSATSLNEYHQVSLSVEWGTGTGNAESFYESAKAVMIGNYKSSKERGYIPKDFPDPKEITGVGAKAFEAQTSAFADDPVPVGVLSTNKKYYFSVENIELAKKVDTKLNNF